MSKSNWFYALIISLSTTVITVVILYLFFISQMVDFRPKSYPFFAICLIVALTFIFGLSKVRQDSYLNAVVFGVVTSFFFGVFIEISQIISFYDDIYGRFRWDQTLTISAVIFIFFSLVSCVTPFITRKHRMS